MDRVVLAYPQPGEEPVQGACCCPLPPVGSSLHARLLLLGVDLLTIFPRLERKPRSDLSQTL
eukprot:550555-Pelagomonas_calceolata.AAC.3